MGPFLNAAVWLLALQPGKEVAFFPGGSLSRDADEHRSRSVWFAGVLRGLEERPLRQVQAQEVYRVVRMPAFGAIEMVRVERAAGAAVVIWKQRPQSDEEPRPRSNEEQRRTDRRRTLTELEWQGLLDRVAAAELGAVTPDASDLGVDGVTYLLEARRKNVYRALFRWSPKDGSLQRLFDYLLALGRVTGGGAAPPVVDPRAIKAGRLVGRVSAGSRAVADVTAMIEGGGVVEDRASDRSGRFAIEGLVPGLYTFRVERSGFPIDRTARGPFSVRWEWDQVLEVRPGETTCVDIRYERAGPEPRIQSGCPAR
jgi:hypothetical protein